MKYRPIISQSMDQAPLENIMRTAFYRCTSADDVALFLYDRRHGELSPQDLERFEGQTFREVRRHPDLEIVGFQKGTFYPLVAHFTYTGEKKRRPTFRVDFGAVGLSGPLLTVHDYFASQEPILRALQSLRDSGVNDTTPPYPLGHIPMRSIPLASWF